MVFQKYLISLSVPVLVLVTLIISEQAFAQVQESSYKTIHLKFKEQFKPGKSLSGKGARSGVDKIDRVSEKYKAVSLKRIFPDAGIYEEAHKAYGLHLWYEIKFSKDAQLEHAIGEYKNLDYFQNVEECKEYATTWKKENSLPELPTGSNDPLLSKQWHIQNKGQTGGTPGVDINLLKAWQVETGSPNVIVAVIDGGINVKQPDLTEAMWTNADEIPYNRIDDDHNGYIDDVNGYNFADDIATLYLDPHATHVAGIIGAVSNNGIGVSGIAGGTGSGDGVRIMSCAGFGMYATGGFEAAMVYAADNGAVISQNSWGGGSTAIEAAIDYFISRAGYDNSVENFSKNIQTGPMAGGLVIFAAGNSDRSDPAYGYPASYQNSIAVASTNHNDVKSDFSNYGTWVDISAPGEYIYSTLVKDYGTKTGTSMACPQVSGVAALVVSNLQRLGLKPSEVWNRIRLSAQPIALENPAKFSLLGSGRLDAFGALKEPDAIAPSAISDLTSKEIHSTSILLAWTATGENGNDGQAAEYEIRYSTSPINELNFSSATQIERPPFPPASGTPVNLDIKNLVPKTMYYFALKSRDIFNNVSGISNVLSVTTFLPPIPEVVTTQLSEQIYTGAISKREVLVKNSGEDILLVRLGVPNISPAPVGLPTGAKGKLFAINTANNTIEELNITTGKVVGSVSMPEPSSKTREGLAFDGTYLYYGKYNKIYKLNANTGEVIRTISLTSNSFINGIAWSGQYLYVSTFDGKYQIYEIDSDTGTIRRTIPGYSELTFSGNHNTLYKIDFDKLTEVDLETGQEIRQIPLGGAPKGLAYSAAEDLIFVSDLATSRIHAVRPGDGTIQYSIPYLNTTALAGDEYKLSWVEVKEQILSINGGETVGLPVTFISTGLTTGEWKGSANVITTNLDSNPISVQLSLNVTGAADVETISKLDFGTQYVGFPIDSVIVIENRGSSDLIINEIRSASAKISNSLSSQILTPGQKISMMVSITPEGAEMINSFIQISSNDPDEGTITIPVTAQILVAPVIELDINTLAISLSSGTVSERSFTATNKGGSPLHWNIDIAKTSSVIGNQTSIVQNEIENQSSSAYLSNSDEFTLKAPSPEPLISISSDPQSGMIYARAIGNNFYRYRPATNTWEILGVAPTSFYGQAAFLDGNIYHGGAALNVYSIQSNVWSSIPFPLESNTGILTSDGQYIYAILEKSFYRYDPIHNNWLQLSTVPQSNQNIPISVKGISFHSGVIYAQADNGFAGDGNTFLLKYFIPSDSWIMSVVSIPGKTSTGNATDPSGHYFVTGSPKFAPGDNIQMAILDLRESTWNKMALPFEVSTLSGLVYVGNPGVSGIYFTQGVEGNNFGYYKTSPNPDWITTTPPQGHLNAGDVQTFKVGLNATGLFGGTYESNVKVYSNDPIIEDNLHVKLNVIGAPEISISKDSVDIGGAIIGKNIEVPITIKNTGTAELIVSNILSDNPAFTITKSSFNLPIGESIFITVYFTPTLPTSQTGTFTFHTNDTDESEINFVMTVNGVYPAKFEFSSDSIIVNLLSGEIVSQDVTVSNTGDGSSSYLGFGGDQFWMGLKSEAGEIAPKESKTIQVIVDAKGIPAGIYYGNLLCWNYGDLQDQVPIKLTVTSASDIFTSLNEIDFGDQFINNVYDSIFEIKNNGVLPLSVLSTQSDNPSFTLLANTPISIDPGKSLPLTIRFNPTSVNQQSGKLTITSDDPDERVYEIKVSGNGINPPVLILNPSELVVTGYSDEAHTKTINLGNSGGSTLKWQLKEQVSFITSSTSQAEEQMSPGDFSLKSSSPYQFTALSVNPVTGKLYGQNIYWSALFEYDPQTNGWQREGGGIAYRSSKDEKAGSVVLNSKMYCVYSEDSLRLYVYDIILKDWSSRENKLGAGTATITTDGTLLYLAGGGHFKSYNPVTEVWTALSVPTISLDGSGGLSYYDGAIYAHESSGGFAKYTIATQVWENLGRVPAKTVLGSTIDSSRKRYYAYGNDGNSYLYEYDMDANSWSTRIIGLFEVGDSGGLGYISTIGFEGIYFGQGNKGSNFGRYESKAELPWIRISPPSGETPSSAIQSIGVNFNPYKLNAGTYQGSIQVATNDPGKQAVDIPVTFKILSPAPIIEITASFASIVDRVTPYKTKLNITNNGLRDTLYWNINNVLPPWLTLSKQDGFVLASTAESIEVTFTPDNLTTNGLYQYLLEINSNDPTNLIAKTSFTFKLENLAPVLLSTIGQQNLTTESIEISLTDKFADPDNDPLTFSAASNNPTIVSVSITNSKLIISPHQSGVSKISVTSTDIFNLSATSTFDAIVEVVTGIEPLKEEIHLTAFPNPFQKRVIINYHSDTSSETTLSLFNAIGKEVWSGKHHDMVGQNEIEIDSKDFTPGLYYLILIHDGVKAGTLRLIRN